MTMTMTVIIKMMTTMTMTVKMTLETKIVGGVDLCGGGGPSSSELEPDMGLAALLPPSPPLPPLQEGAAMVRGPRL